MREREQQVHEPADDRVDRPAEVRSDRAEHRPEHDRHGRGEQRDGQRDARAVDQAGKDVATIDRFNAEPVRSARELVRLQRHTRNLTEVQAALRDEVVVDLQRAVSLDRCEDRREDRHQDKQNDETEAGHRDFALPDAPPCQLVGRLAFDLLCYRLFRQTGVGRNEDRVELAGGHGHFAANLPGLITRE